MDQARPSSQHSNSKVRSSMGSELALLEYQKMTYYTDRSSTSLVFSYEWYRISDYIFYTRMLVQATVFAVAIAALLSFAPTVYSYLYHNLGMLNGFRFFAAVTSLAAPLDNIPLRELLWITIPDMVITICGVVFWIAFSRRVQKEQFDTQGGLRRRKTTPAVRVCGYQPGDQNLLKSLVAYRQFVVQYDFKGAFRKCHQISKNIELSQKELNTLEAGTLAAQMQSDKIKALQSQLKAVEHGYPQPTGYATISFDKQNQRINFVNLMRQQHRTTSLKDHIMSSFKQSQLLGDSTIRLYSQYVDQPFDLYPEQADIHIAIKILRVVLFAVIFIIVLWIFMAIISLPIVYNNNQPVRCSYPNNLTLNQVLNNKTLALADRFCFCQNLQHLYFTSQFNQSYLTACFGNATTLVLMDENIFVSSGFLAALSSFLLTHIVPILADLILVFSSCYQRTLSVFWLSVSGQVFVLALAPILINLRIYNLRGIDTVNFLISSFTAKGTFYNDFTRMWFANLSVWFMTLSFFLIATPWLNVIISLVNKLIAIIRLKKQQISGQQFKAVVAATRLDLPKVLAPITAVYFYTLIFSSGVPALLPICLIVVFSNMVAITIQIFGLSTRGYLPPGHFYGIIARVTLFCHILHSVLGNHMFGSILDCSPVSTNPTDVFDYAGKFRAPVHYLVMMVLMAIAIVLFEIITPFLKGIRHVNDDSLIQSQIQPSKCASYSLMERYKSFYGQFNLPDRMDGDNRLANMSSNQPQMSNGRLGALPASSNIFSDQSKNINVQVPAQSLRDNHQDHHPQVGRKLYRKVGI